MAAGAAAVAMTAFCSAQAMAQEVLGQPTPKGIGLQPAAAPLKESAIFFHNGILMPIITAITLFVAALLVWVIVRYNRRANPVPAKFSHNTVVEVIWTLVPVLILVFIAIFSFRLLFQYNDMPRPDLRLRRSAISGTGATNIPTTRSASSSPTCCRKTRRRLRACPIAWPPPSRWWFRWARRCGCWSPAPT